MSLLEAVRWDDKGLVAAIVQDRRNGRVLMQAWMNVEALNKTLETGRAIFWSRSRGEIWEKGLTSGNTQQVHEVRLDCDGDTVLLLVDPAGPACHTGQTSCFYRRAAAGRWHDAPPPAGGVLSALGALLDDRKRSADPGSSYTASLFHKGRAKIAQKVGEEGVETALAGVQDCARDIVSETADLWFHSLVLLADAGLTPDDVFDELARRTGTSGHAEKAARGKGA